MNSAARVALSKIYRWMCTADRSIAVLTCAMTAAAVTLASYSAGQERTLDASQDEVKDGVVVILSKFKETEAYGAGLIAGHHGDMVYIATANHVVRRGPEEATGVEIRFRRVPERRVRATLLERFDPRLDLAVLAVNAREADGLEPRMLQQISARDAQFVSRGEGVYSIGHPNGQLWWKNVTQDRLADVMGDVVRFESFSLAQGHSGGALVNSDNELIAMIRSDQPPTGVGSNIHAVMRKLSEWGYPVSSWTLPADIGGNWVAAVPHDHVKPGTSWPDERQEFEFRYDGRQITGVITSISHNIRKTITSGRIRGNLVAFENEGESSVQKTDGRRCPVTEAYAGEVQGDSLRLNLKVSVGRPCSESYTRGSFVATRRPRTD
jgi:hypothetical protein